MHDIEITGAAEGSLKNISLKIPKNKLVAFTGVSGCGKSTLLIDVLFNECQRQYLEAMAFQGIQKPKVQRVRGASPAIVISQAYANKNPRSTVGTLTDTYTDLRMLYEKLGARACPHCGSMISAADCREETEKRDGDFYVYMYCSACGRRMDKLTRTFFSFNTKEGACPVCEGLGRLHTVDREKITDESLSLKEGAVRCWEKQYAAYQTAILGKAFSYYGLPASEELPVGRFSTLQKAILYEGTACEAVKNAFPGVKPPKNAAGRFEGVAPMLRRRLAEKNGDMKQLESYFKTAECPACRGERLCGESRAVTVNGVRLPQLSLYSLEKLYIWAQALEGTLSGRQREMAAAYLDDLQTKLNRLNQIGLLYLTLDRQTVTLSGGELQRLRLAAALDSELSGVIYILDEPTAGLHPKDTAGLAALLARLRDLGNTVLVIEHDADIIARADHIVDMGPGSGQNGGEIVAVGTPEELRRHPASVTGRYLARPAPGKASFRKANEYIHIENADVYNLKNISVHIPVNCLTCVAGPSGSGKSTLIFEVLAQGRDDVLHNRVTGLGAFGEPVMIGQAPLTRMRRSNVATYIGVYG
ncbi:MAG: ATP-binding cassette domain-containing protein, partial [Oscillospiraceae bacterium]|nr:ATP-binding cassette domain-containing protein [Oscillospiraceae bacterium]